MKTSVLAEFEPRIVNGGIPDGMELCALRTELSWYRDFFDQAPDMFALVDAETGVIMQCNQTLLRTLGKTYDEVVGVHVSVVYHEEDLENVERAFEEFRVNGEASSDALCLRRDDGKKIPVSLRVSGVRDNGGRILYSRSIWRDISLKREVESLRLESRIREAQRMESLAMLSGGVAHDFSNLLVGVLGHAGLALEHLPEESSAREDIESILSIAKTASGLTHQMLAYAGKGKTSKETIDLSELGSEMGQLLIASIPKNVALQVDLDVPGAAMVEGDGRQLRQIIMNLITNGADAVGAQEGTVTFRTGTIHATEAILSETINGDDIQPGNFSFFEVTDSGCGMSKDVIEQMFDPCFSTKHSGHGLGLAATLGILKSHGGAVSVVSVPERGTRVRVLLPFFC